MRVVGYSPNDAISAVAGFDRTRGAFLLAFVLLLVLLVLLLVLLVLALLFLLVPNTSMMGLFGEHRESRQADHDTNLSARTFCFSSLSYASCSCLPSKCAQWPVTV